MLIPWKESCDKPRQHIKKQRHHFAERICIIKVIVFPVVMYGCESWTIKEGWVPKDWCFQTIVLEKTFEGPLDCKEIKPINPKGNQPWIFTERTDADVEAPILWPPNSKSWLTGKGPDAGKDWSQEEKGQQRMRWLDGLTDSVDMNLSKLRQIVKDREAQHATVRGVAKSRTWLSNWTVTTKIIQPWERRVSWHLWQHGWNLRAFC